VFGPPKVIRPVFIFMDILTNWRILLTLLSTAIALMVYYSEKR